MLIVQYEHLTQPGMYESPQTYSILRMQLTSAQYRQTAEIAQGKRSRTYVMGRHRALADLITVGDRLDGKWQVKTVQQNQQTGLLEVITEEQQIS